ncbi:MAG: phosphoribosyltransferase [Rhodocyclaceae bacterium]|nr:phosphoribosyltransferase [Rhodocyclaceae bacterium]
MVDSVSPRCEIISWSAFHDLARRLARKIADSGYRPDVIVAIGRGGYVPGRVLSDFLDQMDLTSFKIEHYRHARKQHAARVRYPLAADVTGRRVLLVDDVADSGETFAVALAHLNSRGAPAEIRSAVLHYKTVSPYVPDYYAQKAIKWRWIIYPWAVAEDVGSFIRAMRPQPASADEAARRLAAAHGIRLPRRVLADLFEIHKAH